jgi:hypothetical protein
MGVEWDIGCVRCRRFVWLGSQKPYKWEEGFQIGAATLRRFLGLHPFEAGCELSLANDGTAEVPWDEDDSADSGWREDLLSRSFWDSWGEGGQVCAQCGAPELRGGLRRGDYLWLCGEACLAAYRRAQAEERGRPTYDSTDDPLPRPQGGALAIACLDCRSYCVADGQEDARGMTRDLCYLAHFLSEHIGGHRLAASFDPRVADAPAAVFGADGEVWTHYVY